MPTCKRILIVEDELEIAIFLEDLFQDEGYEIVGLKAKGTVSEGIEIAKHEDFDVAILDVNLYGELSFPIARILQGRKIPFVFHSGNTSLVNAQNPDWRALNKPSKGRHILAAVSEVMGLVS